MSVGEEPETVEDVYEPFLLQAGLVMRTPRGRLAAPGAYGHLGLEIPAQLAAVLSTDELDRSAEVSSRASPGVGVIQDRLFAGAPEDGGCTGERDSAG